MMGELFASDVKGIAAPLAGTLNWLLGKFSNFRKCVLLTSAFSAFVITKTFTNLKALMGDGETFWLFSGLSILGTIFVFFIVPETKGKSLSEIQKMLGGETKSSDDTTLEEKN